MADHESSRASTSDDDDDDVCDVFVAAAAPSKPKPSLSVKRRKEAFRQRAMSLSAASAVSTERQPILRWRQSTIYTAGRPPWFNVEDGQAARPVVIGICGGSASGKTTVAQAIISQLDIQWVTLISMDSFYKVLDEDQHALAEINEYNFDHPDAFDFDLLIDTMKRLSEGKKVEVPIYNFVTHSREQRTTSMYGADIIILEGILTFHGQDMLDLLDTKVFVDADPDVRLARRLSRDTLQRGRDVNGILQQYQRHVKPAFDLFIAPSMVHADIIVPRGGENEVAINLIVHHVKSQLDARGYKLREKLIKNLISANMPVPATLKLLPNTPQIRGLHTFVRCKNTSRDDFMFYAKRLIRLVLEYTLSLFPFETVMVETPQQTQYEGRRCLVRNICGVSILRAGETMEAALNEVSQDIKIGKVLIQTNGEGEAELYYLRLPKDIRDYHVILMDSQVATGAAALMAIRILLDHDVRQEHIYLVSLLMAEVGVQTIAYAFPQVNIVTTAVDPTVNDRFHVLPGFGSFGDRYFGTE